MKYKKLNTCPVERNTCPVERKENVRKEMRKHGIHEGRGTCNFINMENEEHIQENNTIKWHMQWHARIRQKGNNTLKDSLQEAPLFRAGEA